MSLEREKRRQVALKIIEHLYQKRKIDAHFYINKGKDSPDFINDFISFLLINRIVCLENHIQNSYILTSVGSKLLEKNSKIRAVICEKYVTEKPPF